MEETNQYQTTEPTTTQVFFGDDEKTTGTTEETNGAQPTTATQTEPQPKGLQKPQELQQPQTAGLHGETGVLPETSPQEIQQELHAEISSQQKIAFDIAKTTVENHINNFNKNYPEYKINNLLEIAALPNGEKIINLLKQSSIDAISVEDAFIICNKELILEKTAKAAKQEVRNSLNSKAHLQSTVNNGSGEEISVPANVMQGYKDFGFTYEEAVKDYKNSLTAV